MSRKSRNGRRGGEEAGGQQDKWEQMGGKGGEAFGMDHPSLGTDSEEGIGEEFARMEDKWKKTDKVAKN